MKLSLKSIINEDLLSRQHLSNILKLVDQINDQFPRSLQKYLGGPISKESFMEPNMLNKIIGTLQQELNVQQDSPVRFQAPSFHNLELLLDRLHHIEFMLKAVTQHHGMN